MQVWSHKLCEISLFQPAVYDNEVKMWYVLGMQQYGSLPYCVLPLSVLQYIAVLQYMIKFEKEHIMSLKLVFSSKG